MLRELRASMLSPGRVGLHSELSRTNIRAHVHERASHLFRSNLSHEIICTESQSDDSHTNRKRAALHSTDVVQVHLPSFDRYDRREGECPPPHYATTRHLDEASTSHAPSANAPCEFNAIIYIHS